VRLIDARSPRPRVRGSAFASTLALAVAATATPAIAAAASPETQLPAIASKKTSCPRELYRVSGKYPVTVMFAAENGHHPTARILGCTNAYAIALAGKNDFRTLPFHTGKQIMVAGATYTLGVGGSEILPATSGPVYGWFGNGIEVLLIVPSGT
jgi:hypothetical protein